MFRNLRNVLVEWSASRISGRARVGLYVYLGNEGVAVEDGTFLLRTHQGWADCCPANGVQRLVRVENGMKRLEVAELVVLADGRSEVRPHVCVRKTET